jgi:predicted O-methyltransferase YrrM
MSTDRSRASPVEPLQRILKSGRIEVASDVFVDIHSSIDAREVDFISRIVRNDPGIVRSLEVGLAFGISALTITLSKRDVTVSTHDAIDPHQRTQWQSVGLGLLDKHGIKIQLYSGFSEIVLPDLCKEQKSYDLIFIDGWHTFDHTLIDLFYSTKLLRNGGYLIIDDLTFPSVKRAVDYIKNYPCYSIFDALPFEGSSSIRRKLMRVALRILPIGIFKPYMSTSLQNRLFEPEYSMICLKKIGDDTRNWDWFRDF